MGGKVRSNEGRVVAMNVCLRNKRERERECVGVSKRERERWSERESDERIVWNCNV